MESLLLFIVPIIGGLIWYSLTNIAVKAPGHTLNQKFVSLGTLKGKTLDEITYVVGPANSVSAIGNGQTLRQWQATSYHIALLFDENNVCLGVSSEIR